MSKTSRLLEELITLPSVNPAFLPARHPHAGEGRVAEFLASVAADAGLEVEFQKALPHRPNLVVRLLPKSKSGQRILLAPHLDTVTVANEIQFTPRKKGGRLYGRGACDTKGSVAAMMTTLCQLARSKQRPTKTEIVFVGLIDEENEQSGSRALVRNGFTADLAIVGEPTRLQVVTAHKGSLWLQVETRGKAAHGATPHFGRNAVHTMAQVVDFLETDYAARLRKRSHSLLGSATVSVGSICGGSQPNIVPDRCTISVDRRTLPGETEVAVCREISTLLRSKQLPAQVMGQKLASCVPLETSSKLPLVRQFLRSAGQARPAGVNFFCDAAVLAQGGIPSVVFGPGDIAQAHTADEWISLASLERGKEMLLNFLKSRP
jgi:acetylornithine deacetylase/succinyl-diaminopimelate desuccinylase-like protein